MEGGAITAAVIFGAIISIMTLIVGRGSKISELRQAWINDQRADLAAFGAAALSLASQRSKDRAADFDKLETAAYRVRLRENPRKKEWAPVIEEMDTIRAKLLAYESQPIDVLPSLITIGDLTQERLKKDWNKVRFGELGYRALLVLLVALVGISFWMGYDLLTRPADDKKPVEQHLTGQVQLIAPPSPLQGAPIAPQVHHERGSGNTQAQ
jgi:hypothetical protein